MAQPNFTQQKMPSVLAPARRFMPAIVVSGTILSLALLLCALALWLHYGTTVFFEMVASGISACF